ncbi:hypothetical protein [Salinibacterium sp. TMP30]|uniref:hypothetical protein n=1 Tax=Salinibacterium sp. TMP30 TaxID=3138237 RepID=UPI0031396B5E
MLVKGQNEAIVREFNQRFIQWQEDSFFKAIAADSFINQFFSSGGGSDKGARSSASAMCCAPQFLICQSRCSERLTKMTQSCPMKHTWERTAPLFQALK